MDFNRAPDATGRHQAHEDCLRTVTWVVEPRGRGHRLAHGPGLIV